MGNRQVLREITQQSGPAGATEVRSVAAGALRSQCASKRKERRIGKKTQERPSVINRMGE